MYQPEVAYSVPVADTQRLSFEETKQLRDSLFLMQMNGLHKLMKKHSSNKATNIPALNYLRWMDTVKIVVANPDKQGYIHETKEPGVVVMPILPNSSNRRERDQYTNVYASGSPFAQTLQMNYIEVPAYTYQYGEKFAARTLFHELNHVVMALSTGWSFGQKGKNDRFEEINVRKYDMQLAQLEIGA